MQGKSLPNMIFFQKRPLPENPDDWSESFNMAYLAIRGSGAVNGVSRLHGAVSRNLFEPLFPHWPVEEVPVGQVTNGVHMPSWDSAEADDLWTKACGKGRWLGTSESLAEDIRRVPDSSLWQYSDPLLASRAASARIRTQMPIGIVFQEK
jgi:starch phosphorylase